ncbi:MAG: hypothetical protein RKE49_06005 [Oceanicaulis sp.]
MVGYISYEDFPDAPPVLVGAFRKGNLMAIQTALAERRKLI